MIKELVSIRREKFDENKIQGFVLDESEDLILINYVYDFNLDGLMVLRKKDISLLETSDTDTFQTSLLIDEKIHSKVNYKNNYDLTSWKKFIETSTKDHKYFIVEEEEFEKIEFNIGSIFKIDKESIAMRYFTGTAHWLDEPVTINYSDITCIQIGSNYLNTYERFFNKLGV